MEDSDVSREGAKVAKGNKDLFTVSFAVFAPSRETGLGQTAAARLLLTDPLGTDGGLRCLVTLPGWITRVPSEPEPCG